MRSMLAIAALSAVAAISLGALAGTATPGEPSPIGNVDSRGGVDGALSYRARTVTPAPGHSRALRVAFARSHAGSQAKLQRLLEATHRRVLWALATFTLRDGTVVAERFSWRGGQGWRDLGATRAACPAVPPEVRSVWRLTAC
jgi:hypothetical protein